MNPKKKDELIKNPDTLLVVAFVCIQQLRNKTTTNNIEDISYYTDRKFNIENKNPANSVDCFYSSHPSNHFSWPKHAEQIIYTQWAHSISPISISIVCVVYFFIRLV